MDRFTAAYMSLNSFIFHPAFLDGFEKFHDPSLSAGFFMQGRL